MQREPTYRRHAVFAGVFFIIATVFLFIGEAFYKAPLTAPDALVTLPAMRAQVTVGILIEFACVLAIPMIAVSLYPVLSRVSAALAIGYVVFRLFEATIFASTEIDRFFLLALADANAATGPDGGAALTAIIDATVADNAWTGITGPIYNLAFVAGMLMLNVMLWTARLVPRWISGWGLVMAVIFGALALTVPFVDVKESVAIFLIAPLAVQEMVLALWFIIRGFDRAALARLP